MAFRNSLLFGLLVIAVCFYKYKQTNSMARSPEGLKPTRRLFAWVRRGQRLGSQSRIIWISRPEFAIVFIQIVPQLSSRCWRPLAGVEPATSCTTDGCANQLHHGGLPFMEITVANSRWHSFKVIMFIRLLLRTFP